MAKSTSKPSEADATETAVPAASPAAVKPTAPVVPPRPVRRTNVLGAPGSVAPQLDNANLKEVVNAAIAPAVILISNPQDEQIVKDLARQARKDCEVVVNPKIAPVRAVWRKQSPGRGY